MHINDRNAKFFSSINIILKIELTLFGPVSGLTELKIKLSRLGTIVREKLAASLPCQQLGASHDTTWLPWERLYCRFSSKKAGFWSKSAEMGVFSGFR